MATATGHDDPHTVESLEAELEEVRRELAAKERRGGATQLAAFFAVLLGLAALLAVAFRVQSNNDASTAMHNQMGARSAPMGATMGTGAASRGTTGAAQAGGVQKVSAKLGDFWVRPSRTSVSAGKVTFTATNVGKVPHELMIERMPMKMDGPGQPNEEAAQGMIDDMDSGQSGHMTVNLKPGNYMLFCNAPGHYAAGQHIPFKVTG